MTDYFTAGASELPILLRHSWSSPVLKTDFAHGVKYAQCSFCFFRWETHKFGTCAYLFYSHVLLNSLKGENSFEAGVSLCIASNCVNIFIQKGLERKHLFFVLGK